MSLSKILKHSALGLAGFIVAGEIYYLLVSVIKEKLNTPDEKREICEALCTQDRYKKTYLTSQMKFVREESLFITEVLENLIKSAQSQIHVAMYIFTNHILYEALQEVRRRGVKVFIIVDESMFSASGSQVQKMQRNDMNVKIYSRATMHHKFCLIDAPAEKEMEIFSAFDDVGNESRKRISFPKHGLLITGSLNWTREACTSNVENFIVTSNPKLIKEYQRFFNDCWNVQ